MKIKKTLTSLLLSLFLVGATGWLVGCEREDESFGEKVEDAVDDVGDGLEEAADEVEDAVEDIDDGAS